MWHLDHLALGMEIHLSLSLRTWWNIEVGHNLTFALYLNDVLCAHSAHPIALVFIAPSLHTAP